MDNEELQRLLMATFADEAEEQLQSLDQNLLALEKAPADADVQALMEDIFREAHSLKGAARAVELPEIERIAHHTESLFGLVKSGTLPRSAELFDVVYRALDGIRNLCESAKGADVPAPDVPAICAELELTAKGQPVAPADAGTGPVPDPAPSADAGTGPVPNPAPTPEPVVEAPKPKPPEAAKPAPAPEKKKPAANNQPPADETVRVATSKLDSLMAQVGELLAARIATEQRVTELSDTVAGFDALLRNLRRPNATMQDALDALTSIRSEVASIGRHTKSDSRRLAQVTSELQDDVRRTRMLPVSNVFDQFPRQVRDLARETGKQVALVIEGGDTEVDRSVLEQLKSPLQHLVRNCIDHGLETADVRTANGKRAEGQVKLAASQRGANLVIEISDDGAGIDLERVRAKAVENGLCTPDAAEAMPDREALWMIFRSGFSTRAEVSDLSGRGVGMDVVREHIERLHGMIDLESTQGSGSVFRFSLPLSVATTRCLLVQVGSRAFGVPITNVDRIVRLAPGDIAHIEGREAISVDGRPMALARLGDVLDVGGRRHSDDKPMPAVILGSAERRVAFLVDELIGAQEVAMKSLPRPLVRVRHIAGATIIGTGAVVPILNVADLLRASAGTAPKASAARPPRTDARPARPGVAEVMQSAIPEDQQTVLIADDSATIRTLEKTLLEGAGYIVKAAADGQEAWNLLQNSPEVSLVISDVEMPHMSGFQFAEKVRGDGRYRDLPFVLMTTLNSPEDRERGITAGADAYIVKGSFEQDKLLETVRRLV